jgi:HNH endonuclease
MPAKRRSTEHASATYQRNRKLILSDNPPCHWCGINAASEADHLIETDRGGTSELDNLVPACRKCNATRGNKYRAARDDQRAKPKQKPKINLQNPTLVTVSEDDHSQRFFTAPVPVPVSPISLSPPTPARVLEDRPELAAIVSDRPRLETTAHSGCRDHSQDIADFAENILGVKLMRWQRRVLAGMTAYNVVDGKEVWVHRVSYTSVARQNGKTVTIAALLGWFLCTQGKARGTKQLVMSVAHKLDLATVLFNYLAPILEVKFGATVIWSYGRQMLTMPDGSQWMPRAATPGVGHGYSIDLCIVDEWWAVSEDAIDNGLMPAMRARKNPLMAGFSTAGDASSKSMLRWREQGLRAIDSGKNTSLYFAEFSPPIMDYMTREAWVFSNPALAEGLLDMSVIEAEAQSPDRNSFLRASVNIFVQSQHSWIEPGQFTDLANDLPMPNGGVLAIESAIDESRYVGVRAVQDGLYTRCHIVFVADTIKEMWEYVATEIEQSPMLKLALVPSIDLHCPPIYAHRKTVVGHREVVKWTGAVRALITEKRITHSGQAQLIDQVERAVAIKHNGVLTLSSTRSPGDISACRAMVFAVALASKPIFANKPTIISV